VILNFLRGLGDIDLTEIVSVVKVCSNLDKVLKKMNKFVGGENFISTGDTVLLKPNIHDVQLYTAGGTTNPYDNCTSLFCNDHYHLSGCLAKKIVIKEFISIVGY
jgi:hypothetical protein